jgi:hypothetical protein
VFVEKVAQVAWRVLLWLWLLLLLLQQGAAKLHALVSGLPHREQGTVQYQARDNKGQ